LAVYNGVSNKGWMKNNINRLLVKFGTGVQSPVESLLSSQENKPQSHRTVTEISREASIISSQIIHKDLRLKFCKKSRAQQLTEVNTRYFQYASYAVAEWYEAGLCDRAIPPGSVNE